MKGLWSLISYEYKKILRKKSVWIALILAILITIISVPGTLFGSYYIDGELYESHLEAMVKDREYARDLSGRKLDSDLIMESVKAYSNIPGIEPYQATMEYQKLARPYSAIYGISRSVYNTRSRRFNMEDFQVLPREQADIFYILRHERLIDIVEDTAMSTKAKAKVLELDDQIETPITFSYVDGYTRFFNLAATFGLTAAFVAAICIAPLFSGEYTSGADQIILSSKYGKNKLIKAKLLTGFSLAALICLMLMLLCFVLSMAIFGSDGGGAALQLYIMMSPYPVTMGQTAIFMSVCTLCSCLMTAAITMLLSAKLRTPFGVIILVGILLIIPLLFFVPESIPFLYKLSHLLPTNIMTFWAVTDGIQFELFGLVIKPYVFLPVFAILVGLFLIPFSYRSFKNHQIT
ncbi:MAG: hypothetical protein K0S04_3203 [Herbinix sp.]|jgi:ABC-type transport system involved in multi-copper enzyme maturation permease subunit|nr:hypothetical protein [Herbinix sp.]